MGVVVGAGGRGGKKAEAEAAVVVVSLCLCKAGDGGVGHDDDDDGGGRLLIDAHAPHSNQHSKASPSIIPHIYIYPCFHIPTFPLIAHPRYRP